MASTSCNFAASELLRQSLAGEPPDASLIARLAEADCSDPLFSILVEGLADRFEPRLCEAFATIFAQILERSFPDLHAADLMARYQRIRRPRVCDLDPARVFVLSRVTLGADIAITSVILDAAKQRFPRADIFLVGSAKAAELFAADTRIQHRNAPYPRGGTLADRLAVWQTLRVNLPEPDAIVIDPDSRLTQLGLLEVCDESRYFFFESRAFGGSSLATLTALARRWAMDTFGVDAQPYIAPESQPLDAARPCATVSLGVGGNVAKQLPAAFEAQLIQLLCSRFATVIVDRGFGVDEFARVDSAIRGTPARTFEGSFARFASLIGQSDFYLGYDSAGQHAAAASGTPLVTLFKGFASDRMFARWKPDGPGPRRVVKISEELDPQILLRMLAEVLEELPSGRRLPRQ